MNPNGLGIAAALASATGFAIASVFEQRAAARQPKEETLKPGLLVRLVKRPVWASGLAIEAAAYLLQFVALGHESLVVVQLLLVGGLLIALPLGAALSHRRIGRRDLMGAGLIVAGLSSFFIAATPREGRPDASLQGWIIVGATGVIGMGLLLLASRGRGEKTRAVCLGAAAGISIGLAAALTKASAALLTHGVISALTSWQPYALVVAGAVAMLLAQSAYQAGSLEASLPTLTVTDPLASIGIGALFLGESLRITGVAPLFEVAGLAALVVGVFWVG
jgi:drug/metabolite transporter (DMT)-like permease